MNWFGCGFFNTAQTFTLSDMRQVSADRVNNSEEQVIALLAEW